MNGIVTERGGRKWKLMVEVASKGKSSSDGKKEEFQMRRQKPVDGAAGGEDEETRILKKTNRVIIRNLSFYAKESHVRTTLSTFGEVVEFTLPTVSGTAVGAKNKKQHRGFCFATFRTTAAARAAVDACAKGGVEVKGRQVAVDWAVSKDAHEQTKRGMGKKDEDSGDEGVDEDSSDSDSDSDEESDGDDDGSSDSDDSNSDDSEVDVDQDESPSKPQPVDDVGTDCTAFVRNVPFDCTSSDLFKVFLPFGKIARVYVVKDPETGVNRGTAFVKFQYKEACARAIEAGKAGVTAAFVTEREATAFNADGGGGIVYRGRRLLVDLAVDKGTAESLKVERDENGKAIKKIGKDKRNLFLKEEASVKNAEGWEELGRSEKEKRQRADKEMSQKLRSPLFFINPFRLSFRNLNKEVDEKKLKKLVVEGIQSGIKTKRIKPIDVTNYLQATGLPQRDCIGDAAKVPEFDNKNVKKYIPSLYVDREVLEGKDGKKTVGPSRGYAFVEFTHHAHALACLRELNNNKKYSKEWAQGGSKAEGMIGRGGKGDDGLRGEDGKVKWPRLVVEFACENKVKAKKQAEKKEKVAKNTQMQRDERKKEGGGKKEKKLSRGKAQREKKRKAKEDAANGVTREEGGEEASEKKRKVEEKAKEGTKRERRVKDAPQKGGKKNKIKVTEEDKKFDDMVSNYKKMIEGSGTANRPEGEEGAGKKGGKRWFD